MATIEDLLEEAYRRGFDDGTYRWGYYSDGGMHEFLCVKGYDPDTKIAKRADANG